MTKSHDITQAFTRRPSTTSFQSLALQDSSSIMSNMHQVMTARLYEEEQTQRTMVALHEIAPFYPGKAQTEVHAVLQKVSTMIGHVIVT